MSDVRRDPAGSLYRLDADLSCHRLFSGIIVPNSLAWSPDSGTMYFADTYRARIAAYDYDAETLAGSVFAVRPGVTGLPEGRFAG